MIKLKDILFESTAPNIFVPRRMEDRIERMISLYVKNGSKGDLDLSDLNLTVLPDILKNISVGRDFYCRNNNVQFTREQVRAVCDVKGKIIV